MSGPVLLSFVVADDIRREASGQYTYVGTYLDVNLDYDASVEKKNICVVATLIGLEVGPHEFVLTVNDLDGGHTFQSPGKVYESEGNDSIALVIQELVGFYFPTPGRYEFSFSVNGNELVSLPIRIKFSQIPNEDLQEEASESRPKKGRKKARRISRLGKNLRADAP